MSAILSLMSLVFLLFGILMVIWLVMQVEYTVKFSWFKASATITAMSLLLGFGVHFLLLSSLV
ncbi:MAG: hypothetical protein WED04_00855 [Promethearchaeati archaeon SRVP18_Atabeyarchaeia-1]